MSNFDPLFQLRTGGILSLVAVRDLGSTSSSIGLYGWVILSVNVRLLVCVFDMAVTPPETHTYRDLGSLE